MESAKFEPTNDELERINEALKNDEFRKMFMEYAEEISNPENRKKMEDELRLLERQNGVDVEYMRPEPCFCVKIKSKDHGKIFVNICKAEQVETSKAVKSVTQDGRTGVSWNLPHKFSPVRSCLDKEGKESKEHDVTFHNDTLELAAKSQAFKEMLIDAALETLQKTFNYSYKRSDYKILVNVKSKSTPATLVVSKKNVDGEKGVETKPVPTKLKQESIQIPKVETKPAPKITELSPEEAEFDKLSLDIPEKVQSTKEPEYKILYRDVVDISRSHNNSSESDTKPQNLVVKIELPKVETFKDIDLNVEEKHIHLSYRDVYKLDLDLPVAIDSESEDNKCMFHKDKKQLELVLKMQTRKQ